MRMTVKENSAKRRYVMPDTRNVVTNMSIWTCISLSLSLFCVFSQRFTTIFSRKKGPFVFYRSRDFAGVARWHGTTIENHASRVRNAKYTVDIPRSSYIMFDRSACDHTIFHLAIIRNGRIRRTRYTRYRPRRHYDAPGKSKFRACATRSRAER